MYTEDMDQISGVLALAASPALDVYSPGLSLLEALTPQKNNPTFLEQGLRHEPGK